MGVTTKMVWLAGGRISENWREDCQNRLFSALGAAIGIGLLMQGAVVVAVYNKRSCKLRSYTETAFK